MIHRPGVEVGGVAVGRAGGEDGDRNDAPGAGIDRVGVAIGLDVDGDRRL